jgi:hypothetical protein
MLYDFVPIMSHRNVVEKDRTNLLCLNHFDSNRYLRTKRLVQPKLG